jgi:hypothetical protein
MDKESEKEGQPRFPLPRTSTSDLRGRQSVRATFKLSGGCLEAISIVSRHLGIKQKSLFDHLMEDIHSLSLIARGIVPENYRREARIQKTFVISRRSLTALDKIASDYNTPRDALVEFSVHRLLPIIEREREKHARRKEIVGEIRQHFLAGKKMLQNVTQALGEEDPVTVRLAAALDVYGSAYAHIGDFIEQSREIEDFHLEDMTKLLNGFE